LRNGVEEGGRVLLDEKSPRHQRVHDATRVVFEKVAGGARVHQQSVISLDYNGVGAHGEITEQRGADEMPPQGPGSGQAGLGPYQLVYQRGEIMVAARRRRCQ
jgi:hypothetical protein